MQNTIQDQTKLKLLFDYILQFKNKNLSSSPSDRARYKIYTYAVCLCDFNKFPQVVNDNEYNKLLHEEIYRGALVGEYNANLLVDYDYHYGQGYGANGIYGTSSKGMANLYSRKNPDNVLAFKLANDVKIATERDVLREYEFGFQPQFETRVSQDTKALVNAIKSIKDAEEQYYIKNVLLNDCGLLAMLYGYDALLADAGEGFIVSVMNREKIVVSQSEFDRVCALSKAYKDGTINFEQKEFLNE